MSKNTEELIQEIMPKITRHLSDALLDTKLALIALETAKGPAPQAKARERLKEARSELLAMAELWLRLRDLLRVGVS